MKIKLYKAKHFWKNRENATWIKSDLFDDEVFSEFKNRYESIKYSKERYITIRDKTLFLFYQSKKDIFDRKTTEITGLLVDKRVRDADILYDKIQMEISDIFDDRLEYSMDVKDDLIAKDYRLIYYGLVLGLFLAICYSIYLYTSNSKPIEKASNISITKESKKSKWKWRSFCEKYNIGGDITLCYQAFTKQKCEKKENSIYPYIKFIRQSDENSCNYIRKEESKGQIRDIMIFDKDLEKNINKKFFIEEKK